MLLHTTRCCHALGRQVCIVSVMSAPVKAESLACHRRSSHRRSSQQMPHSRHMPHLVLIRMTAPLTLSCIRRRRSRSCRLSHSGSREQGPGQHRDSSIHAVLWLAAGRYECPGKGGLAHHCCACWLVNACLLQCLLDPPAVEQSDLPLQLRQQCNSACMFTQMLLARQQHSCQVESWHVAY